MPIAVLEFDYAVGDVKNFFDVLIAVEVKYDFLDMGSEVKMQ